MALADIFKTKQFKSDAERLSSENEYLKSLITPEMQNALSIKNEIDRLKTEQQQTQQDLNTLQKEYEKLQKQIDSLNKDIDKKKKNLIILDDESLYQDFALYTPVYNLMNSEAYKDKIEVIRTQQKDLIKKNAAATFPTNFTYNGSLSQGQKMVKDNVTQILRAFNNECEAIIDKVKFNNVESIRKRIIKSCEDLNKLNVKMQIAITPTYLDLKLQEMNLCYEYALKKQEEKEELKRIRAEQKEEQRLQKEIEEARKTSEKEQAHYTNALKQLEKQIQHASAEERQELEAKQEEIMQHLNAINNELQQLDYREANQRAGYVYVISNIGSFGKDIYKIGMTRRLDPTERVDELGDASVPFAFDIHAMIFSDDAPALEAALHRAFDSKKVNMVNTRREFFHVTLEEIEEVVKKNFDKTVEFTKVPSAEQFRESQMIRRSQGIPELIHEEVTVQEIYKEEPKQSTPHSEIPVLDSSKEYLHTKWGIYEMPKPYTVKLQYGDRKDTRKVSN